MKKLVLIIWCLVPVFHIQAQTNNVQVKKDSLNLLIQKAKEDTLKVDLLNALSDLYPWWTQPDTCLLYAKQALSLAENLNYQKGIFKARRNVSGTLNIMGNYFESLEYALKNFELSKKLQNTTGEVESIGLLAGAYFTMGDYNSSLQYRHWELALTRQYKLEFQEHLTLTRICELFLAKNQPDSALFYGRKAYQAINYWPTQPLYLGNAHLQKENFDSAIYWYRVAIDLAIKNHTELDFVDVDNNMALIHKKKNNTDSAIWYAKKSMSEKIADNYPLGMLKATDLLASLYSAQNKPDSAFKYLRIFIGLKDSLFSREKAMSLQNLVYNNKEKQKEIEAERIKFQIQLKFYLLSGGLFALLIIAIILFRMNQHKQRSFLLLQQQKDQVDLHKTMAEKSLNELKAAQAQLIQSEKMASLGQLTAGIAHEIQNPLNFVNNFSDINAELIQEASQAIDAGNSTEAKQILSGLKENEDKIRQHGQRADAIVKNMIQHSGTSSGKIVPTDINALADEYLRLAYHGIRVKDKSFNATFKTDFDESIGKINVIPQDIGRVLLNLYNNAFYAVSDKVSIFSKALTDNSGTADDGHEIKKIAGETYEPTVTVSTKLISESSLRQSTSALLRRSDSKEIAPAELREGAADKSVNPLIRQSADSIIIAVKDNGNGIPEKVVEKVFQPFFTTKPTGVGTGLGLSLSYDIIKAHGGEISIRNNPGEGAEFVITLPVNT